MTAQFVPLGSGARIRRRRPDRKNQAVPNLRPHAPWTAEEIEKFRKTWPIGTHQRTALELLRLTGLRRGDAIRLGPKHVTDGLIEIATEKTGETAFIPIGDELTEVLAAAPAGETFITGAGGEPVTASHFAEMFRNACHAAGVDKTPHGLRKTAATTSAERGYSESELEAVFAWRGGKMASHYTRTANRKRLALEAAKRSAKSA
jgi:integrase